MTNSTDSVPWKQGSKVEQKERISLKFPASEIFPLLCPVEEYKWLPSWGCTMVYSQSGVAEKDAVFLTQESDGIQAVQTIITYEPSELIEFLVVKGNDTVERIGIALHEDEKGTTEMEWSSFCVAYSEKGNMKQQGFSSEALQEFLVDLGAKLTRYLANKPKPD